MLKKKAGSAEKKRKHSQVEERHERNVRRGTAPNTEPNPKDEHADSELDRIGSDIEEGGLDLSLPFRPITAYATDKRQMLEQCLRVLGEKKLQKMLPDELKDCSLEEIKNLCWEQLEPISERNLIQILAGEELTTSGNGAESTEESMESQQDNNIDSTSCIKETAKAEEPKQEVGGSGEESDVLSINADAYDSDIEGQAVKAVDGALKLEQGCGDAAAPPAAEPGLTSDLAEPQPPPAAKKDIQSDIEKSVSEILAAPSTLGQEAAEEPSAPPQPADVSVPAPGRPAPSSAPAAGPPSLQQLELLELEMRARAIKALMKAGDGKKASVVKNT